MSKQLILIDTSLSVDGFKSVCPMEAGPIEALQSLENYVVALEGGNQSADVTAKVGAVSAFATFTVSSTGSTNGQAGSLLNVALSAVTSNADPAAGEFNINATPTTQAASMQAAIEAVLSDKLIVSRNNAVITLIAKIPGVMSNGLQISAGNLANVVVAQFSGGSDGTEYTLNSK